jgi:hypothetical protein
MIEHNVSVPAVGSAANVTAACGILCRNCMTKQEEASSGCSRMTGLTYCLMKSRTRTSAQRLVPWLYPLNILIQVISAVRV